MRAIMLMFDSLKRDWLPNYGGDIIAPNFARLAERCVTFDNFYIGSMPCMPARRELHTGRYNFFHKGWSPLEPFDDSAPELLKNAGVHTHIVSDHHHYWREGGGNYHGRYSTYEHIRGQEGDFWKGVVDAPVANFGMSDAPMPDFIQRMYTQDGINRTYMDTEEKHHQTLTFAAGMEFIETNQKADNWFLNIESFDPHEPFFTYEQYQKQYPHKYEGRHMDWPAPSTADQDEAYIEYLQNQYKALVTQIDGNVGKVLDMMDKYGMWQDTMLIVNTDHGILMGEHDWWSKGVMPPYNEIARLPFFIWDPREGVKAERRSALAQNIDVAATLLEFFGVAVPQDMEGKPLRQVIQNDAPIHDQILFGYFGGSANITDGRYIYMRGPVSPDNAPLNEYTLIPASMGSRADVKNLQHLTLQPPFRFTKGCSTLKIDMSAHNSPFSNVYRYGTRLYDLEADPGQKSPVRDDETELRLIREMLRMMRENDAPPEQYERLGLKDGMTAADLEAQRQTFADNQKPDVLADLNWTTPAVHQLKTLIALLHDPKLAQAFEAYAKDLKLTAIESSHIYDFAKTVLPKAHAGMAMMMMRLSARID